MSSNVYRPQDIVCVAATRPWNNCVVPNGSNRIGDKIFIDNNKDWLQDLDTANDGIGGIIINLRKCNEFNEWDVIPASYNGAIQASTVSALAPVKWQYGFEKFPAGKYYVEFDLPRGVLSWTNQGASIGVANDSDVNPDTNKTRCMNIAADTIDLSIDAGVFFSDTIDQCISLRIGEWPSHLTGSNGEFQGNDTSLHPIVENPFIGAKWLLNFSCEGGNWSPNISLYKSDGSLLQSADNQWNSYDFTQAGTYKVVCKMWTHTYKYCQKDISIRGDASMGTYVWWDKNGDWLQDERTTHPVAGVLLKLYQCDGSQKWLASGGLFNNMSDSYEGTFVANMLTKSDGSYAFTWLDPQWYYYVQMEAMPDGYKQVTTQFVNWYAVHPKTNSNMNPVKQPGTRGWRTTCELPEDYVDIGLIKNDIADLQIIKTVDKPEFKNITGTEITWTLNYKNNSSNTAKNVRIIDMLPYDLTFVSGSTAPTSIVDKWILGTLITWNVGDLTGNAQWTITIISRYSGKRSNDEILTNTGKIMTDSSETTTGNNTSSSTTTPKKDIFIKTPSCVSLVFSNKTEVSSGVYNVDYNCSASYDTSAVVTLFSGGVKILSGATKSGSFKNIAQWVYTASCVINGNIDYAANNYYVEQKLPSTPKCTVRNIGWNRCAVKSAVNWSDFKNQPLPDAIVTLPQPLVYCEASEETQWSCDSAKAKEFFIIKEQSSCNDGSKIKIGFDAAIGDRAWNDVNKNGVQDAWETGVASVHVWLYTCSNSLLATGMTNANGDYLFDDLSAGWYKVKFDLPATYNTFTSKMSASTTTATDSNVDGAGWTDCITIVNHEKNLSVDAGMYAIGWWGCDPTNICCNGSCGWGGWPYCGDGTVSNNIVGGTSLVEQCDDGNRISGDGCSATCQKESTPPISVTGTTIFNAWASCGMIDPPDVMIGEYVPFWWSYEDKSDIKQVSDCNMLHKGNSDPSKVYVINSKDEYGQFCYFRLKNHDEVGSSFVKYCNVKQDFATSALTKSYLGGSSSVVRNSYQSAMGASYIAPNYWYIEWGATKQFDQLWEYQIIWDKISFYTCNRQEVWSGTANVAGSQLLSVTYKRSTTRQVSANDVTCSMNMTVTSPYMTQQNGLSASTSDQNVMDRIKKLDGVRVLSTSPTTTVWSSYQGSSNLGYLVSTFVDKYSQLATQKSSLPLVIAGTLKRIPGNKNIYVASSTNTTSVVTLTSSTPVGDVTLIVPNGNVRIIGTIKGNLMLIVPNGTITVQLDGSIDTRSSPNNQSLQGIYISQQMKSDTIHNTGLDGTWRFWWQLKIDGLVVNLAKGLDAINTLKSARRATLKEWFTANTEVLRLKMVQNGSSLQINTSPSLWTNLPPGANELVTELQSFK